MPFDDVASVLKELKSDPKTGFEAAETLLKMEGLSEEDQARILDGVSRAYVKIRRYRNADKSILKAKELAKKLDAPEIERRIYQIDSAIACELGDFKRGIESATRSIEISRKIKDEYIAIPLMERAVNYVCKNDYSRAIEDFQQALSYCQHSRRSSLRLKILANLATVFDDLKLPKKAIARYKEALELAETLNDTEAIATLKVNLGSSYVHTRNFELAEACFVDAIKSAKENQFPKIVGIAYAARGDMQISLQELDEAKASYEIAKNVFKETGDGLSAARAESRLISISLMQTKLQQKTEELISSLQEKFFTLKEAGNRLAAIDIASQLIEYYRSTEDFETAMEIAEERDELRRDILNAKLGEVVVDSAKRHAAERLTTSEIIEDLKSSYQKILIAGLVGALIGLVVILGILTFSFVQKKRTLNKLKLANARIRQEQQQNLLLEKKLSQQEKIESLSAMSAGVIHDFNNYLAAIVGGAEVGKIHSISDRKDHQFGTIIDTAMNASELTKKLSEFIGLGAKSSNYCEVGSFINSSADFFRELAGKDVNVKISKTGVGYSFIDPVQIQQILSNLIVNSREAMAQNSHEKRIDIKFEIVETEKINAVDFQTTPNTSNYFCQITVTDNGKGMTEEQVSKSLDPFFSTKSVGRGLGLASVNGIVKANDGYVSISSQPGEGASVVVGLPRVEPPVPNSQSTSPVISTEVIDKRTVLYVEDDEAVRTSVASLLRFSNMNVFEAEGVDSAMEIFEKNSEEIEIIITDYEMQPLTGVDLANEIRKHHRDYSILLVSGYAREDVTHLDLFDGYVAKPFTIHELREQLNRIAGLSSAIS